MIKQVTTTWTSDYLVDCPDRSTVWHWLQITEKSCYSFANSTLLPSTEYSEEPLSSIFNCAFLCTSIQQQLLDKLLLKQPWQIQWNFTGRFREWHSTKHFDWTTTAATTTTCPTSSFALVKKSPDTIKPNSMRLIGKLPINTLYKNRTRCYDWLTATTTTTKWVTSYCTCFFWI